MSDNIYRYRRFLLPGLIGATIAIVFQAFVGFFYLTLRGTACYTKIDDVVYYMNWPCFRLVQYLVRIEIIPKHSGVSVVSVFFISSATIGFIAGSLLGIALCVRQLYRRGPYDEKLRRPKLSAFDDSRRLWLGQTRFEHLNSDI